METDIWVMRECVKAYLTDVRHRAAEQRDLEWRITEARERADGMAAMAGESVSASSTGDALANAVALIEELEGMWADCVDADAAMIAEAEALCLRRHFGRWVCFQHWTCRRTWADIARTEHYSEDYVRKEIAREGVIELYPLIPEAYRRDTFPNAAPL